jgi:hypothetical protein
MPIINVTVAGAPLGSVQRVNISAQEASDPDALFGRLQDSLGVPIGEVREGMRVHLVLLFMFSTI